MFQETMEYPPALPEPDVAARFVAPGPVSRVVADYLEMCSPRRYATPRADS